jgi:signal transduction histidine kinase
VVVGAELDKIAPVEILENFNIRSASDVCEPVSARVSLLEFGVHQNVQDYRRAIWRDAGALILIALAVAALSFVEGDNYWWLHHTLEPVLLLGAMFWFFRQNIQRTRALERSNIELAEVVAHAQESASRAEAEARQKSRLAALLDTALGSAPIGFAFFDRDLRFLRVNDTLAAMNDRPREDHVGLRLRDIAPLLSEVVEPELRRVLETRKPVTNVEFRMPLPGSRGEARDWLSSFYPIVTRDGELFGIGAAVTDLTAVKRLEEQFLQAQKMEAVGRLAGGVAHDFNNLLTVITSYAELILFDPASSGSREELQEIRAAAARAAKLTRQLLAFSRRQAMDTRVINPNDVLHGTSGLLSRVIDAGVNLDTQLAPDVPTVHVDPGQLEQVMMNLAINAADAMPEGGDLIIETSRAVLSGGAPMPDPDLAPGVYAVIRVRDTGVGMDAATVAQIFEPFFTTKEAGRGTGLGLSTVYGIVKQSGGGIAVDSTPGVGTVFTVYLPAAEA